MYEIKVRFFCAERSTEVIFRIDDKAADSALEVIRGNNINTSIGVVLDKEGSLLQLYRIITNNERFLPGLEQYWPVPAK